MASLDDKLNLIFASLIHNSPNSFTDKLLKFSLNSK